MEAFGNLSLWGGGPTGWILPFLVVLSIVVFIHELGHFLVARWFGVRVLVFSIGFGRELVGFNDRHGTRWKISAIPLGGYVKFFGDANESSTPDTAALQSMTETERRQSFFHQKVGPRSAVVAAGPIANFLLAIVIFAGIFMHYGKPTGAARVDSVRPDSAAAAAGLQPGDVVLSIDGRKIEGFLDMQRIVTMNAGRTLEILVERGGAQTTLHAVPAAVEEKDRTGTVRKVGRLGINGTAGPRASVGPVEAVGLAANETWFVIENSLVTLGRMIIGTQSAEELGGPILIAEAAGQMAKLGFAEFLNLIGVLSVSIGLLNLFPVPLLDGGHLLFYAIEALRGRPLPERAQEVGFRIGFAAVIMLMLFVTYKDIVRLAARWTGS